MTGASVRATEGTLAGQLHRLAVLIAAGLAPRAAWMHVAVVGGDATLTRVVTAIERGVDIGDAIAAGGAELEGGAGLPGDAARRAHRPGAELVADVAWRSLAAAWRVATESGAPLAPALRGFAEGLRDREAARRDIRIALAGPRATARIVMVLPVVAVLLGLLMGVDLARTVATPWGAGAVIGGLVLVVVARRWMRRLLRAAEPPSPTVGLALDLLAVAAGGGGSPEAAAALVERELHRVGLADRASAHGARADGRSPDPTAGTDSRPRRGETTTADSLALAALVHLSRTAGAPLGELARADAVEARAVARADARESAERLAVRLMLPLGACILPAFLLLGVVPMLIGLLSSTAGAW